MPDNVACHSDIGYLSLAHVLDLVPVVDLLFMHGLLAVFSRARQAGSATRWLAYLQNSGLGKGPRDGPLGPGNDVVPHFTIRMNIAPL